MAECPTQNCQLLREVHEEGAVFSLILRKEYCDVDESNVNRLLWTSKVERVIKAGVFPRLVQQLAPHGEQIDHSYRTAFLAVYRTFATPTELLQELIKWYIKVIHFNDNETKERVVTQRSIISFLRLWIDKYTIDFNHPPLFTTLSSLEDFLQKQLVLQNQDLRELHKHVLDIKHKLALPILSEVVCECGVSECKKTTYDWFNNPAHQVAQHLTALDAEVFASVVTFECLHYVRQQKERFESVTRSIQHFNRLSRLVIATILQSCINDKYISSPKGFDTQIQINGSEQSSPNESGFSANRHAESVWNRCCMYRNESTSVSSIYISRGMCISKWIDIAHHCRLLKNFSSLKAIVFGLQSSSVFRISKSWSTVSNERLSIFKELNELFSSDSNFQLFRDVVNKEATGKRVDVSPYKKSRQHHGTVVIGIVPYLGTFLTDLTMLHNAVPDKCKDGLINFEKRRQEFEILAKISLFQTACTNYNIPSNPSLRHWIYSTPLLSDEESFQLSKELEPDVSSSPTTKTTPLSPCDKILGRSLRGYLMRRKETLFVPVESHLHGSMNDVSTDSENKGGIHHRSSSCFELSDDLVVRVSVTGCESCNYKSILVTKSDHTSKVIKTILEKYDLTGDYINYQLYQQLEDKEELLIPHSACVYYALDTTMKGLPLLSLQLKDT